MKLRQSIFLGITLTLVSVFVACSGSNSTTTPPPPTISIAATAGNSQSAAIGQAFATALQATVTSNGSPASGVSVTFTAPSSGASGTFATSPSAATDTETTNSSGIATAQIFTANATAGTYTVSASTSGASSPANFSLTNTASSPAAIAATSGSGQSAVIGAPFSSPLVATVTDSGGNPVSGVSVTFTAPSTGASGTFATNPPAATDTETTNSSGAATSQVFTANTTTGTYAVTASTAGVSTPASFSLTNTTPPPIAVSIGPSAISLQISTGGGFTAFVANDPANAGVTWTVSCGSAGACGTFSAASVLSGVATDYSAPSAIPTNSTVTLTATSVTDSTKSASRTVTITGTNTALTDGTYVFSLGGQNGSTGALYYVGGAFQISGGSVVTGEQDYVDNSPYYAQDSITGGSISSTTDGNLIITLNTNDTNIGVNGTETLDATMISTTRARLIEFDSLITAHGRMDLQSTTAAPSNGYAFMVAGLDGASPIAPVAIGGVINIDNAGGSGNISGNGSVFDINDGSLSGPLQAQTFAPSTYSVPDSFGRILFSLVPSAGSGIPPINLVGYTVDSKHMRLVEASDSFGGAMGGIAIGQGTNTGSFSAASILGSSYVVGISGADTSTAGVLQTAGVLTANNDGTSVSGAINYNDFVAAQNGPSPITGGTYTVDPTGRVTMMNVTDGNASFTIQIYLNGQPGEAEATVTTMDMSDIQSGLGWIQTGGGTFTASSLFGSYVLNASGYDPTNVAEYDAVGPVVADGNSTLVGSTDLNWLGNTAGNITPAQGAAVSGIFTASPNGAFTGTITGLDVSDCTAFNSGGSGCTQDAFSYYLIDTTKVFFIETDTNQLTLGFFTLQQ